MVPVTKENGAFASRVKVESSTRWKLWMSGRNPIADSGFEIRPQTLLIGAFIEYFFSTCIMSNQTFSLISN